MSAKEMFEELGYFYDKYYDCIIIFETKKVFGELEYSEVMRFYLVDEKWWKFKPKKEIKLDLKRDFDIKLFKAINKQIEELEA